MEATAPRFSMPRFNARILVFALVAGGLLGFPAYIFLTEWLTGGVVDRGSFYDVQLKTMSTFDFDQKNGRTEDVPEEWRKLDGKRIRVEGEIVRTGMAVGVPADFDLVYSIANCCYSGEPQIQHFVKSKLQQGADVKMGQGDAVRVMGTLHVDVQRDPEEGKVVQVYRLDVESIEPK